MGPVGREHLPGRADARAAVLPAARARVGAVPHAGEPALHVWFRDASGRRHYGSARSQRRAQDPRRHPRMIDVAIIGGGHNGLVAAYYLAKAGLRPVVFERRDVVGGGALTAEIHPGFRCPVLSHETLLHGQIVRDMNLERHGLALLTPAARTCALSAAGAPLVIQDDDAVTAEGIRRFSMKDAAAYPAFREAIESVASVLGSTFDAAPPDIDHPGPRDLWNLLQTGRRFRALGKRNGYRLLRWLPMPVGDLTHEWFETELLRATLAAPGLSG